MSIVTSLNDIEKEEGYQHIENWAAPFCEMIEAIAFPVRFPADFEILCNTCSDAMEECEYEEYVLTGPHAALRWLTTKFLCRNCGEIED